MADALVRRVESLPIHPQAYAVISRQGGLTDNLSNQFSDLLAQAGLRQHQLEALFQEPRGDDFGTPSCTMEP